MEKLILIHGFGGSPTDWDAVIESLGAGYDYQKIDLKKVSIDAHTNWSSFTERLQENIGSYERAVLCGYSLGGRIALHLADRVQPRGLILLSAGFGEESGDARASRRQCDRIWAEQLRADAKNFWQKWYDQELFASVKLVEAARREGWLSSRFLWNNEHLANYLERLSPAEQNWMLPVLSRENSPPTLYLAGEKDKKYVALSRRVKNECRSAQVEIIPGSSHALPLEAPEACARAITNFLTKLG